MVTVIKLIWESHHATNSWEPDGTGIGDDIWEEIDAVKMRPVQ